MKMVTDKQYNFLRSKKIDALCFLGNCVRVHDDTKDSRDNCAGFGIVFEGTPKDEKRYNEYLKKFNRVLENNKNLNITIEELRAHLNDKFTLTRAEKEYIIDLYRS